MPIVTATQLGLNATFWGINPCFDQLTHILSERNVSVEPIQTDAGRSIISIGTPSIVVYQGEQTNGRDINEKEIRDLKISYEPSGQLKPEPKPPDRFTRVSQVSGFAASYLRAHGYKVNVSIEDPEQLPDLDLNSQQIRFDQVDPAAIDPEVLRRELGLEY